MPSKSSKKKAKPKQQRGGTTPSPATSRPPSKSLPKVAPTVDTDDDDDIPALEPASYPNTPNINGTGHPRTGLSPELESVHLSTTASLAAMTATPELNKAAQDLYSREVMNDIQQSEPWLALPPTIRNFVETAVAHGVMPTSDMDKSTAMYAAAQQIIANGAAKARGTNNLTPHPPGAWPGYPPLDASIMSDPAFTQALEQLIPKIGAPGQPPTGPLPPTSVLQNDFGVGGDDYYSEDEEDEVELDVNLPNGRDVTSTRVTVSYEVNGIRKMTTTTNHTSTSGTKADGKRQASSASPQASQQQPAKKSAKTTSVPVPPTPTLPPPPNPAPNPPPPKQTATPAKPQTQPQQQQQPPPTRPAPTPNPPLPPSSRAAGKQPMAYPPAANNTTVPPRSARANGKAPATPQNHYHNHATPPANTKATPTKPRPPAVAPAPASAVAVKKPENKIWNTSTLEERERIKDFWLGLSEKERRKLVQLEKDAVLKKMKEQQRHSCSCAVCGRKRSAIEEELEVLYDAYYEELELYANQQQQYVNSPHTVPPPPGPGPFPGSVEFDQNGAVIPNDLTQHPAPPPPPPPQEEEYDEEEEEYEEEGSEEGSEDEEEDEDAETMPAAYPKAPRNRQAGTRAGKGEANGTKRSRDQTPQDFFTFGPGLTVAGNILTVADDLLKNDGTKFLEMMEQLAERRMYREELAASAMMDDDDDESEEEDEGSEDESGSEEDEEEEEEDDQMTDSQKMEEGRRMFSIFAARMFEQRVLHAYREKVAQDRQNQLIRELAEEDRAAQDREAKKLKEAQKKKEKKKQLKQAKEEEAARKAHEQAEREAAEKARKAAEEEETRKRKEKQRLEREAQRKAKEDERIAKEMERRKKLGEEREREAERKRKEKEEKDREKERTRKEREEKERIEREKKEAERVAAEALRAKEEAARREKEEKEKQEREAAAAVAAKLAAEEKAKAAAVAAASPQPSRNAKGNKKVPPKLNAAQQATSASSSAAPTPTVPPVSRPSPTPSAIPLQSATQAQVPRVAPSPGGSGSISGRRATAPALGGPPPSSAGPSSAPGTGPMPPIGLPFPPPGGLPFGPPSPAAGMTFGAANGGLQFGQHGVPPLLQSSPVPRGFGGLGGPSTGPDFHAPPGNQPFPLVQPGPIGPPRGNPSPGPNSMQLMSPGPIGPGFSPGPTVSSHSRRSSLDPIGSRPFGIGAIQRPIAPIGTRPDGSSAAPPSVPSSASTSLAPGTPIAGGLSKLDGDEIKGSPVRRSESPERLGSSALLDPTDEPILPANGRRGTYWTAPIDMKPVESRFGSGPWSAFGSGALPPPSASPWGASPISAGAWSSNPNPPRGSFSPIGPPQPPPIGAPPFGFGGAPFGPIGGGPPQAPPSNSAGNGPSS